MHTHFTTSTPVPPMPTNASCYWYRDIDIADDEGGVIGASVDCTDTATHMEFDHFDNAWHPTCESHCSASTGIVCERSLKAVA